MPAEMKDKLNIIPKRCLYRSIVAVIKLPVTRLRNKNYRTRAEIFDLCLSRKKTRIFLKEKTYSVYVHIHRTVQKFNTVLYLWLNIDKNFYPIFSTLLLILLLPCFCTPRFELRSSLFHFSLALS
jgi:hypothetical protein